MKQKKPLEAEMTRAIADFIRMFYGARTDVDLKEALMRSMESGRKPAAAWARVHDAIKGAMADECVTACPEAMDFLEMTFSVSLLAAMRHVWLEDDVRGIKAFTALTPGLAGEHLGHYNGRENGGKTMERRADEHANLLKKSVEDLLKNPSTADWSDRNIARWLMEEPRALHKAKARAKKPKDSKKPNELSEKTMTTRVKEIRAAYKASI
jgi:hypothetical protein